MCHIKRSRVRQLLSTGLLRLLFILTLPALLALSGCTAHADPAAGAPPPANIMPGADPSLFTVDHLEQFPLAAAVERPTTSELIVTGTVTPDIACNVPVVSLASGRVVALHARLGDTVQKGQVLLTIRSDDVAGGFDAYRKAVAERQPDQIGELARRFLEAVSSARDRRAMRLTRRRYFGQNEAHRRTFTLSATSSLA